MNIVWWTIPDSSVAMVWHPEQGLAFDSQRVERSGIISMQLKKPWQPQWAGRQEATGQPLKDLAATFTSEANVLPTNVVITWIDDSADRAVSWDRRNNQWRLHQAVRHEDDLWVTEQGTLLTELKVSEIKRAGDTALGILDRYRDPTDPDVSPVDTSTQLDVERAEEMAKRLPGWTVHPEESGYWTATHHQRGVVSGTTPAALEATIRKYFGDDT